MMRYDAPFGGEREEKYPLRMLTPHPRFSFHSQGDAKDSYINDIKDHRVKVGDRYYWIIRINGKDAADRGIKMHDLVKVFNEQGAVICAALVTERLPRGSAHGYESCAIYEPMGKPGESADLGGTLNLLTPMKSQIKKGHSMGNSTALVEIELWNEAGEQTATTPRLADVTVAAE